MSDDWCLIESDPGVFYDITKRLGVTGVQYEEILSLDEESLKSSEDYFGATYGLIFCFRWHKDLQAVMGPALPQVPSGLFFAKQVIQNSCATQAMLSILLNIQDQIQLGPELDFFKEFAIELPPDLAGSAIAMQETIKSAHNSYRTTHMIQTGSDKGDEGKSDPFHYVAYVQRNNRVFQLDGLQEGPIDLGSVSGNEPWWKLAVESISRIIDKLQTLPGNTQASSAHDIRFNLIVVVPDRLETALKQLSDCTDEITKNELEQTVIREETKRRVWNEENEWRRHDLLPFLLACLRQLAKRGLLTPAYEAAASVSDPSANVN